MLPRLLYVKRIVLTSLVTGANAVSPRSDESRATLKGDVGPGPREENQCHHNEDSEGSIEPSRLLPIIDESEEGYDLGLTFQVPAPPAAVLHRPDWSRLQYVPLMLPSGCIVP